jgi:hypothetical protein
MSVYGNIEIIRATGSSTLPFANITGQSIDETQGILSNFSYAVRGDKLFLIGGNLSPYVMSGFAITPLPRNGELEDDLLALTDAERLAVTCMAYQYGSNEFFKIRLPDRAAYVFNTTTAQWHREQSWGLDISAPKFNTTAYGYDIQADENGTSIYTLDNTVYTDAGTTVERIVTLRPGFSDYEIVGSLCLDIQAVGRPASGQGSDPTIMVEISTDGRTIRDDTRSEVTVTAGPDGRYRKPVLWGLGMIPPGEGATISLRMTDPAGITFFGAWINEGQKS